MNKTLIIIEKSTPNKGILNKPSEKSRIDCSKYPLGTFSLNGGRLYFIK